MSKTSNLKGLDKEKQIPTFNKEPTKKIETISSNKNLKEVKENAINQGDPKSIHTNTVKDDIKIPNNKDTSNRNSSSKVNFVIYINRK
jgi:hypothetical protein